MTIREVPESCQKCYFCTKNELVYYEKLEKEVIELESRLKSIKFVLKCHNNKWFKKLFKKGTHTEKLVVYGKLELLNELKEEILEIINE